jgi:hypothetical protein
LEACLQSVLKQQGSWTSNFITRRWSPLTVFASDTRFAERHFSNILKVMHFRFRQKGMPCSRNERSAGQSFGVDEVFIARVF